MHPSHNGSMAIPNKESWLEPAATVVKIMGGIKATASVVNLHRSVVNRWLLPPEVGGTGGLVPAHHQRTLFEYSLRAPEIDLRPEHFFAAAQKSP